MNAITTQSLTRRFGNLIAVDHVSMGIPDGGVVGLVGPNGSGKSTMIRMLLGLIRPSSGDATVLGESISGPRSHLSRVGALVESPAFVPGLSARTNLTSLAQVRGLPTTRVEAVLETVGLVGRDREPVKRFSLGMKQRLGIATALLPDPDLIVLDEPTNGLDPSGIAEMRALLGNLARDGRTVIVSSHLLSEIEAVCDHLVVIRHGKLLYCGPVAELLARTKGHVEVEPEHRADLEPLAVALRGSGREVEVTGDRVRVLGAAGQAADINRELIQAGIALAGLRTVKDSLEQVFFQLTEADGTEVTTPDDHRNQGAN